MNKQSDNIALYLTYIFYEMIINDIVLYELISRTIQINFNGMIMNRRFEKPR